MWRPASSHCDGCSEEYWPPVGTKPFEKIYCPSCAGVLDADKTLAKFGAALRRAMAEKESS